MSQVIIQVHQLVYISFKILALTLHMCAYCSFPDAPNEANTSKTNQWSQVSIMLNDLILQLAESTRINVCRDFIQFFKVRFSTRRYVRMMCGCSILSVNFDLVAIASHRVRADPLANLDLSYSNVQGQIQLTTSQERYFLFLF